MSQASISIAGLSRRTWLGALTVVALLTAWWLLTTVLGVISPARFPNPKEVGDALVQITQEGYGNGRLHQHVLHSLKLVLMGFTVAVAVGVPLGLLMGYSRKAEALINPAFLLLRPIPHSHARSCTEISTNSWALNGRAFLRQLIK